jgi:hypothetical protein
MTAAASSGESGRRFARVVIVGSGSTKVDEDIIGGGGGVSTGVPLDEPLVTPEVGADAGPTWGSRCTGSPFPGVLLVVQPKAASDAVRVSATIARAAGRPFKFF